MESDELQEASERAKESGLKVVGVTMAIITVLLAFATMLGHRAHTEEILIQTKAEDQWAYYQAKNVRSHMYEANAEMAALLKGESPVAEEFKRRSESQKHDGEQIREKAQDLEKEVAVTSRRANRFDASEIFLEIAIVLCSITLLTAARAYWKLSFISAAVGVVLMALAFMTR
jgi:hypothetical protein